jgi:hypothetical protein
MVVGFPEFCVADSDFYAPLTQADVSGQLLRPARVPGGWEARTSEVWTVWHRGAKTPWPEEGWKVHVSARPGRLQEVLDATAEVCFEHGVPFKHLSAPLFYKWASFKYASRPQAGKFIAAYPADVSAARLLMEALREKLAGEEGPYILSDRRFGDSRTVHYRYGSFAGHERVRADGRRVPLVRDGTGELVPDRRGVSFHLPAGITDPFAAPDAGGPAPGGPAPGGSDAGGPAPGGSATAGPVTVGGFVIESAVRHSNFGGTYRARRADTGERVFIKEARPHTGVRDDWAAAPQQLQEEWEILTALHDLAPGLAPAPVAYFREWEHEFLAMELVPGVTLTRWTASRHPLLRTASPPGDFASYYQRCETIVSAVEQDLARLHALGYLYVDVSPGNVLIDGEDRARLVDFGAARRAGSDLVLTGTPGYSPPPGMAGGDPGIYDSYGLSALAQHLIAPLHHTVQRSPDVLTHLRCDVSEPAPVPDSLWDTATRYHQPAGDPRLPLPGDVAADPERHLGDLRDAVADALLAMADLRRRDRVFPAVVEGYLTNTVCLAYGTAGVVHALRHAGRPLPEGLAGRLRDDALASAAQLGPGLYVGLAGIAWVLADLGLLAEAQDLLTTATGHPLAAGCATLYGGSAGIALCHLALYRHTSDEGHLDQALALAAGLPPDSDLTPYLGLNDPTGLMHGRAGIALMLQQLAAASGDTTLLRRAVRLLHAEVDRAVDPGHAGLLSPVSAADNRQMPYLYCGSAGLAFAITRCLGAADDERLAAALPLLLAPLRGTYTIMPALCTGTAGFAFTLADHARLTGDQATRAAAVRAARGLYKHAIPHPTGVRFLGDQLMRYSADLWSGSAGILLALTHVLDPRPGVLFTAD